MTDIAVIGGGAMGAALATHWTRSGAECVLLTTEHDDAVYQAWYAGNAHPALGERLPGDLLCRPHRQWSDALGEVDTVVLAVATCGLGPVTEMAAEHARSDATWAVATKGWQENSLASPTEVVRSVIGADPAVVALGGPGLAAEIFGGAPTALVCACADPTAASAVARSLRHRRMAVRVSEDVVGVEICSAFKNVVAVAEGMCLGLAQRRGAEDGAGFANARSAVFAQGITDMAALVTAGGGATATVCGLAGVGDLFVTCLGGRNGRFGRLLGLGEPPEEAAEAIGSTVEGVANTAAALGLADRYGLELPIAGAVRRALRGELVEAAGARLMLELFTETLSGV